MHQADASGLVRAAATRRGIAVGNTPDVLTDATADIAMLLILGVTRRAPEGERMVREGRFHGWAPDLLVGRDVRGATLGLAGFGRIGKAVAARALAFQPQTVAAAPPMYGALRCHGAGRMLARWGRGRCAAGSRPTATA